MATKWNVVLQIRVLLASLIVTLAQTAPAFDTSYWVWQRTDALSPEEVAISFSIELDTSARNSGRAACFERSFAFQRKIF
jgi:hypothetical protein